MILYPKKNSKNVKYFVISFPAPVTLAKTNTFRPSVKWFSVDSVWANIANELENRGLKTGCMLLNA